MCRTIDCGSAVGVACGFVHVSPDGLRARVSASGVKEWVTSKGAACVRSSRQVFHRWRRPGFFQGQLQDWPNRYVRFCCIDCCCSGFVFVCFLEEMS